MPLAKMKEELTCPICLELFSHPRRLPCGHSYCHSCIEAIVEKNAEHTGYYYNYSRALVCPECREEINFDYVRGIEGIPTDFKLSKLVELFQFLKTKDDSDSCEETKHPILTYQQPDCPEVEETRRPISTYQQPDGPGAVSSSPRHFISPDQTAAVPAPESQASGEVGSPSVDSAASATVASAAARLTQSPPSSVAGPFASGEEPRSDSAIGAVGGIRRSTDIKSNCGPPCPVNVPDFVVQHIYSSSPCVAGVRVDTVHSQHLNSGDFSSHHDRAHSVPLEVPKLQSTNTEKRKKSKKRNWKSLFAYDSSSTDSSSSDSQISESSRRSTSSKKKQWLMTRFLKSVIFSDSSSSEDDEETASARTGSTHQLNATAHHVASSPVDNTLSNLKRTVGHRNSSDHKQSVNSLSHTLTGPVLSGDVQGNGENHNLNQPNLSIATSDVSVVSSNSSSTLVKKPTSLATERAALDALTIPKRITETSHHSLPEHCENQPTLYDNCHSQAGRHPLISQYDNIGRGAACLVTGVPVVDSVRDTDAHDLHLASPIQSGPRTFYDNVSDSELKSHEGGPSSPVVVNRSAVPQNVITEIENLKTGFESVSRSTLIPPLSPTSGATSSDLTYQSVYWPAELGVLHSLPATSVQAIGHESCYDNMDMSEINRIESLKISQDHRTSPAMVLTTPDAELESETGLGQFHHVYGQVIRTDDDFEFDENYFDTSSEEVSERDLSHLNLAPSSFAIGGGEASFSRSSSGAPLGKTGAEDTTHTRERSDSKSETKNDKVDNSSEDEEEDDGSHSGTSMLQNKKKPRSRLKKFLTSLLSLSSSDDEDEHYEVRTSSSSKSSDW